MRKHLKIGHKWNESESFTDKVTGRQSRQLTSKGIINNTPTFHMGTAFTSDSKFLLISSEYEEGTALLKANVETGELTCIAVEPIDSPFQFKSGKSCVIQARNLAVATSGSCMRLYDLDSYEMKEIWPDAGDAYELAHAMGTHDGRTVYVPRIPRNTLGGKGDYTTSFAPYLVEKFGGMPTALFAVDLETWERKEVYHHDIYGTQHVQPNPVDSDLILMDRGAPPNFAKGSDGGKTTRLWVLKASTGELTEIRPKDANRFQIHPAWSADGEHIFYHGRCRDGGFPVGKTGGWHYIGVATKEGEVLWEGRFPWFYYGHVSSDPQRNRIIIDSLITPDLVSAIDYTKPFEHVPSIETLACHGSMVNAIPGQASHPHCHISSDGKWLSYNRGDESRADACVVRLAGY